MLGAKLLVVRESTGPYLRAGQFVTVPPGVASGQWSFVLRGSAHGRLASFGAYWNKISTPSVKLFVPPMSLYHAWKFQVSPG